MSKQKKPKNPYLIHIGKFYIGSRACCRHEFKWFYHPLIKEHEEEHFRFFVWLGWHFYIALEK